MSDDGSIEAHVAVASLVALYGRIIGQLKARADHFERQYIALLQATAARGAATIGGGGDGRGLQEQVSGTG